MKITIKDAKNFIDGHFQSLLANQFRPWFITEQALFRAMKCYPCLKAGKCLKCGCKTPQMFFSKAKTDSDGKWGVMLSKSQWMEYRKTEQYKQTLAQINAYVNLEKYGYDKELLDSLPRVEVNDKRDELKGFMDRYVDATSGQSILQHASGGETKADSTGSLQADGQTLKESTGVRTEDNNNVDDSSAKNPGNMEREAGGEG